MRTRPILIITICYIIGILWGIYVKKYIPHFCIFSVFSILALIMYYNLKNKKILKEGNYRKLKKQVIFYIICIIVISISTINLNSREKRFEKIYENNSVINEIAIIEQQTKESDYYNNYNIRILNNSNKANTRLILMVKKKYNINIKNGDIILLKGTFNCAQGQRNYKGFNYCQYLKTQNICGFCYAEDIQVIKENSWTYRKRMPFVYNLWINNIRQACKNNLKKLLSTDNYNIAIAILLGDSSELIDSQKQLFSDASLSHILAISGMHVSYVTIICNFVLNKFSKRRGKYIFIILLIFFLNLTGASASVARAVIMNILMNISFLVYRKSDILNNIAISALIILIINPYNLLNLGFQLSFLGTLGIVLFNNSVFKILKYFIKNIKIEKCLKILAVSISANILIYPILIYNFNNVSLIFLVSNLLVVPILTSLVLLGYISLILSVFSINLSIIPAKIFNLLIKVFTRNSNIFS